MNGSRKMATACAAPAIRANVKNRMDNMNPATRNPCARPTDEQGQRWAFTHFADCPSAAQHRNPVPPSADAVQINLMDLPAYMADHRLVVTHSTITDNGNGVLIVELFTRKIA